MSVVFFCSGYLYFGYLLVDAAHFIGIGLRLDFLACVWHRQIFRSNLTQFTKYIRRLLRFPSSLTSDMAQLTDLHEQEVQTIWNHFLLPVSTACHKVLKSSYSSITCSLCTVSINSVSKKVNKELLQELIKNQSHSLVKYECWNITREFFHLEEVECHGFALQRKSKQRSSITWEVKK